MKVILSDNELFRQLRRNNSNRGQIWGFRDEYAFLSHMFPAEVMAYNILYKSVENAYQALMTLDPEWRERIRLATPQEAKRLSKQMPVRPDKDVVKIPIMKVLDARKIQNHPELFERLKATGNRLLIEGNTWHDNFWGDCGCSKCKSIVGLNHAGKILMLVRDKLCGIPDSM